MKRRYRWPLWSLAGITLLLVALHVALPYLVRDYAHLEKIATTAQNPTDFFNMFRQYVGMPPMGYPPQYAQPYPPQYAQPQYAPPPQYAQPPPQYAQPPQPYPTYSPPAPTQNLTNMALELIASFPVDPSDPPSWV